MKTTITKLKNLPYLISAFWMTNIALADSKGSAVDVAVINNLGATVKAMLEGQGALVIDGIILAAAAYGTAVTKSPAPIVCGIVSCGVFHIATKLILG